MAEEKSDLYLAHDSSSSGIAVVDEDAIALARGGNWFSRTYSKPISQVALIGLVCFLCPGMFNALSGIGGGGQVDADASNNSSVALYSTFAAVSFFAGTIHNRLGSKLTLGIGALGYCLYIGSFLSYNMNQNKGFVIAAGAILGVCASLLWTAQGALMLAYPTEGQKGTFISVFWIIFNLGAVLGSAIEFGLTYNSTNNTVGNGVYIGFIVLTGLGAVCSCLLKDPAKMIRDDGTRIVVPQQSTWKKEFIGMYRLLLNDPWVIMLFPMFLASNWFYTWQFNDFNSPLFTLRTRSLNSMLYWLSQMVGSFAIGQVLDSKRMSRRSRAWIGWSVTFVLTWCIWGGSYHKQLDYTREQAAAGEIVRIDFKDSKDYVGLCFLYIFSGMMDAIWQNVAYWLMGACSNDLSKLAILAGLYKSLQSAGAAGAFAMDRDKLPFMTNLAVAWGLCAAGLLFAVPVLLLRVTEHTEPEQEVTAPGRELEVKAASEEPVAVLNTKS
ncbi:MFS general substrate transporter [Violaceomyces palustris]|uniref:MFS general substrate transporter n=1 Tax=Violaceomyces palustris TaxID=1673888 RepID=A0ACD0NY66_9BASI|nr:MFS general substrate transporter [Violaceomyces palustris]